MGLFEKPAKPQSTTIGQNAEDLALQFLQSKGMRLVERNYRCKMGEIDLIMQHKTELVFVEVRYRKHTNFGSGAESIDYRKQQKILKSAEHLHIFYGFAEHFLQSHKKYAKQPCRIDVISITAPINTSAQQANIDWIPNAIQA